MLITAPRASVTTHFATPFHTSESTSARDSFVRSSQARGLDTMWRIARLRQKLPTELPQTDFTDIEALLEKRGCKNLTASVKKAYSVAESAHAGMTRQDGTPYIHHPARVCAFLISECGVKDAEVLQAALLRDVVEDTSVTVKDIEAQFGKKTAEYVDWLTKPSADAFASKEQLNAYQAGRIARAPRQVRMVKVADRIDNVSDLHLLPNDGKMERYLKDTRENYLKLAKDTDPALFRFLDLRVSQLENLAELNAAA